MYELVDCCLVWNYELNFSFFFLLFLPFIKCDEDSSLCSIFTQQVEILSSYIQILPSISRRFTQSCTSVMSVCRKVINRLFCSLLDAFNHWLLRIVVQPWVCAMIIHSDDSVELVADCLLSYVLSRKSQWISLQYRFNNKSLWTVLIWYFN